MPTQDLIDRHAQLWRDATRGAFTTAVRDGTLELDLFNAWLRQDYVFVSRLMPFQARLLARAPRGAQSVLARGALALVDELSWFEAMAGRRGLPLVAEATPTTRAYLALLDRLDDEPIPLAILGLWTLEQVYQDAWQHAAPGAEPYREAVDHWANPTFTGYVTALRRLAEDSLPTAPYGEHETLFAEVLQLETAFWGTTHR